MFDNTISYSIRIFFQNPSADFNTPLSDPSFVDTIDVYQNSAHFTETKAISFCKAAVDVTFLLNRAIPSGVLSSDDFQTVVVQNNKQLAITTDLQPYFKSQLLK